MSNSKTLLGVLAGLAAGATLGLLLAPRSGKETRALIRKKGEEAKDDLSDLLDDGFEQWRRIKGTVVDRAKLTKEEIKDFLEFMAAEGSDLKQRIKDDIDTKAARHSNDPTINN